MKHQGNAFFSKVILHGAYQWLSHRPLLQTCSNFFFGKKQHSRQKAGLVDVMLCCSRLFTPCVTCRRRRAACFMFLIPDTEAEALRCSQGHRFGEVINTLAIASPFTQLTSSKHVCHNSSGAQIPKTQKIPASYFFYTKLFSFSTVDLK